MGQTNDYVTFEEAAAHIGIDKYTLGRIKSGYLFKYIKNKRFNLTQYLKDRQEVQELRHLAHCIYYAIMEIHEEEEQLAQYLSEVCGRSNEQWFIFLDRDLFSVEKNAVNLNWYEKNMTTIIYEEVKSLDKQGLIDLQYYIY